MSFSSALDFDTGQDAFTENSLERHWYAAYTCANHEKKVREQLEQRSVESYLPVYETVRRWKDRRMRLQIPLFPGYVFVRLTLMDRLRVLQIPGIVHLVSFNGHPAALADEEIDALKKGVACGAPIEPHAYVSVGHQVTVIRGPLVGQRGYLVRRKGSLRFVLSIEVLRKSVAVELDASDVSPQVAQHKGFDRKSQCKDSRR